MCSHVKQYVYVIVNVCLWFLLPAYAQIQPQALIKQQPQQFVIQSKPHHLKNPASVTADRLGPAPTNRQPHWPSRAPPRPHQ